MNVKDDSNGDGVDTTDTIESMRDGDRLRAVLEKHGKKPADLERALGKSRQMVHVYMTAPQFSAHMRETIRRGLDKMQIDPGELADDPTAITDPDELRRMLDRVPHDALPDLKRMLEIQDRATRMGLLALIADRIERKR